VAGTEALPRVCERRRVVPRINEIFIAEDDGDDLVSIAVQPLLHSDQICLQGACVQLVTAGVAEVDLVLEVVRFALDC
jgi:hypothetical protein